MILTADEYRHGFITFDGVVPPGGRIALWTRCSDDPTEETEWTGPYADPDGSIVSSPPLKYMQLRIDMKGGPDPHRTPLFQRARLERDGVTHIWPGFVGSGGLVLGRDFGSSYRLIIRPRRAEWPASCALLTSNFRVRFWKEPLTGFVGTGSWQVQAAAGEITPSGELRKVSTDGDVLEILATVPGDSQASMERARNQVESLAGLLAFALGEGVTGPAIVEEFSVATPEGELGEIRESVREIQEADIALLSSTGGEGVEVLESDAKLIVGGGGVGLALRWLHKGYSSESLVDAFLAFFVGLEVLAARWFAGLQPRPVRRDLSDLEAYLGAASPPPPKKLEDAVLGRLSDFPLEAKLQRYWRHYSLAAPKRPFKELVGLRNRVAHGAVMSVPSSAVMAVRDALKVALSVELRSRASLKDGTLDVYRLRFTIA